MKTLIALVMFMPFAVFANGNHEQNSHVSFPHTHDTHDALTEALSVPTTNFNSNPSTTAVSDQLAVNAITLEASSIPSNTTTKIENTPDVLPPPVYPTVPCFKGGSFGFGVPGIGASIGGGKLDPGCVRREMIRIAPTKGHGMLLWCSDEEIIKVFGSVEQCLGFTKTVNSGSSAIVPDTETAAYCQKRSENLEESLVECLEK